MVPQEVAEKAEDKVGLLKRLWLHENMRVFSDRLINESDQELFLDALKETVEAEIPNYIDFNKIDPTSLVFNNFVTFNPNDP